MNKYKKAVNTLKKIKQLSKNDTTSPVWEIAHKCLFELGEI